MSQWCSRIQRRKSGKKRRTGYRKRKKGSLKVRVVIKMKVSRTVLLRRARETLVEKNKTFIETKKGSDKHLNTGSLEEV